MESRPIGSRRRYVECEEPWCAEGPGGAWSAMVDAERASWPVVGPWQYQSSPLGSTPPLYPPGSTLPTHPGYSPAADVLVSGMVHTPLGHARTAVLDSPKEILGVNNALPDWYTEGRTGILRAGLVY